MLCIAVFDNPAALSSKYIKAKKIKGKKERKKRKQGQRRASLGAPIETPKFKADLFGVQRAFPDAERSSAWLRASPQTLSKPHPWALFSRRFSSLLVPLDLARATAVLVSCLRGRCQFGVWSGHLLKAILGHLSFGVRYTSRFVQPSAHSRRSPCTVVQMAMACQR